MVGMSSMCFGQQVVCKLIDVAGLRAEVPKDLLPQHQVPHRHPPATPGRDTPYC